MVCFSCALRSLHTIISHIQKHSNVCKHSVSPDITSNKEMYMPINNTNSLLVSKTTGSRIINKLDILHTPTFNQHAIHTHNTRIKGKRKYAFQRSRFRKPNLETLTNQLKAKQVVKHHMWDCIVVLILRIEEDNTCVRARSKERTKRCNMQHIRLPVPAGHKGKDCSQCYIRYNTLQQAHTSNIRFQRTENTFSEKIKWSYLNRVFLSK